jgi:tRNA nucleotidyltransferase (CCA-adding enzyme)
LFRHTVPVGIEFGTVGVLDDAGVMHEVTTFRRDVKTDGRHAIVEFGASLDEDLARRDLTVNAIAYSPSSRALHDPFGGQKDIKARVIRAVGDPDARMQEDRLRALRAIRFASRFGFEIEPGTWQAIVRSAPFLTRLSAERVRQEIEKTMEQVERPSAAFSLWRESGALASLIPALGAVHDTTLRSVDLLARPRDGSVQANRRVLRITALLSDLEPDEAASALRALRFSNREAAWISGTLERWRLVQGELEAAMRGELVANPVKVRQWVAAVGRLRVAAVWRLALARCAADGGAPSSAGWGTVHSLYRAAVGIAFSSGVPLELADLAVNGDDLRKAGIAPGPALGRVLKQLLDEVIENPEANLAGPLLARAARLAAGASEER